MRKIRFRTGLTIPSSGIYLVRHKKHRLPHEVTLLKGQAFPPCSRCAEAVEFELIVGIMDDTLVPSTFRVVLHQLPELPEAVEEKKAAAASDEKAS